MILVTNLQIRGARIIGGAMPVIRKKNNLTQGIIVVNYSETSFCKATVYAVGLRA
jgi:hypothetical protein